MFDKSTHSMPFGRAIPGMIILLAAGCTTPLRTADVHLPPSFEARADGGPDAAATLDRWWLLFDDPQLSTMVEQALASAPDARSALAVLEEARANRAQALSQYDPQGNLSGSATHQDSSVSDASGGGGGSAAAGKTTTYSGSFQPSWELDLFGRRASARDAADADLAAARFTYEASRQSLATNVASNLFEARGLAVQLREARDSERIASELATVGRKRVAAGIGAPVDAASLDADLATAIANRQSLEAQLSVSKRTLLVLLGRGTDPVDTLEVAAQLGSPPLVPTVTPGELLARRPDVREAEAKVRSAAGNLKLDQLALFPTFNLLPSASVTKVDGSSGYTNTIWSIGASLTLPILDRPRLLAEIRAQRARGEQAIIAYEKAVQTAYGEAEKTLTTYMADRARLTQLVTAEARSREAFEAQRAGYHAGIVDLTTMLTAERTWRSSRTSLSSLQATALTDAVNVFRALGGGWTPSDVPYPVPTASQDKQ